MGPVGGPASRADGRRNENDAVTADVEHGNVPLRRLEREEGGKGKGWQNGGERVFDEFVRRTLIISSHVSSSTSTVVTVSVTSLSTMLRCWS